MNRFRPCTRLRDPESNHPESLVSGITDEALYGGDVFIPEFIQSRLKLLYPAL